MTDVKKAAELAGRTLMAVMFLKTGVGKITAYAGTQAYMAAAGVPGMLLPLVIALEVLGGLALIAGYRTRLVSIALAVFTVVAGLLFHNHLADQMQQVMFLKNLAIAGGFLILAVHGAGAWSIDARRRHDDT
jgi:putative oxidoreductase